MFSRQNKQEKTSLANIIIKYYENKDINGIKKALKNKRIDYVVEALESIDNADIILFVLLANKDTICGEVFKYLNIKTQASIIQTASIHQLRIILFELYNDDVINLTYDLPEHLKKIIISLDSQQRAAIKQQSEFDQDHVGAIVNSEFFTLNINLTITEAIIEIKRMHEDFEQSNLIYVVDDERKLKGFVTIHNLLFANSFDEKVSSVYKEDVFYVRSDEEIEEVVEIFRKYQIEQIAVINKDDELIGYITDNDIQPILDEEATTDIYKMYGIGELDFPYIKSNVFVIFKSRLLWLAILMLSATLTAFLIDKFQDLGQTLTAGLSTLVIVPIIPAMTGTSGNAGSQSAASVIRALSIGEITIKEYNRVMGKEFLVGVLMGFVLGIINFVRLVIYFAIIPPDLKSNGLLITTINNPMIVGTIVSAATSLALFLSIIISKLLGGMLPLFATKLKIDPTIMSTPILSTLLDMVTTIILFGMGIAFLLLIVNHEFVDQANLIEHPNLVNLQTSFLKTINN